MFPSSEDRGGFKLVYYLGLTDHSYSLVYQKGQNDTF